MNYLKKEHVPIIFDLLYKREYAEKCPKYEEDLDGVEQLLGVFDRVRMKYYPYFFDKAAYLYIRINQGHFFSNGNKRLALMTAMTFIYLNGYKIFIGFTKNNYRELLNELFSGYKKLVDLDEFLPFEFLFYNLSLIIADSKKYNISDANLKSVVKSILILVFIKS